MSAERLRELEDVAWKRQWIGMQKTALARIASLGEE